MTGTVTFTVTVDDGQATTSDSFAVSLFAGQAPITYLYLPLVVRQPDPPASPPDLVY